MTLARDQHGEETMNQNKKTETVAPVASKTLAVKTQLRAGRIVAGQETRLVRPIALARTY
jgi:hypothetical protein